MLIRSKPAIEVFDPRMIDPLSSMLSWTEYLNRLYIKAR